MYWEENEDSVIRDILYIFRRFSLFFLGLFLLFFSFLFDVYTENKLLSVVDNIRTNIVSSEPMHILKTVPSEVEIRKINLENNIVHIDAVYNNYHFQDWLDRFEKIDNSAIDRIQNISWRNSTLILKVLGIISTILGMCIMIFRQFVFKVSYREKCSDTFEI